LYLSLVHSTELITKSAAYFAPAQKIGMLRQRKGGVEYEAFSVSVSWSRNRYRYPVLDLALEAVQGTGRKVGHRKHPYDH
jgi:hypothetical protein